MRDIIDKRSKATEPDAELDKKYKELTKNDYDEQLFKEVCEKYGAKYDEEKIYRSRQQKIGQLLFNYYEFDKLINLAKAGKDISTDLALWSVCTVLQQIKSKTKRR